MSQTKYLQSRLVEECRQNNRKAQLQMYDMYCKAMYNTAFNFVKNDAVAEDIVQEGFLKAFQKIQMFTGEVTFGAWLKKIIINQCLDWLKKRKLNVVSIENHNIQVTAEEDWKVDDHITLKCINDAIDNLQENYKIVVKLYLLEGYDHQEIAQILNISEVASRSQLFRGKNKLKEVLKQFNYA